METLLQQRQSIGGSSSNPGGVAECCPGPTTMMAAPTKQEPEEDPAVLRRGPWTVDEDLTLINYIADHGEGRWNALARAAGLNRTGKSCRLRWLNYLRPDVKRGDFTADEQLLILDLHSRWGNRWSKIASQLPGRTDNEIKNYWRTRVQKHAKQLNCDVNSKRFKDAMRFLWMPRLAERAAAAHATTTTPAPMTTADTAAGSYEERRSPSSSTTSSSLTSDHSAATTARGGDAGAGVPAPDAGYGDWWETAAAMQGADQEFWSTASPLQQLTAADHHHHRSSCGFQDQDQDLISGWVQGFSEAASMVSSDDDTLWSLDDIWRTTMHC